MGRRSDNIKGQQLGTYAVSGDFKFGAYAEWCIAGFRFFDGLKDPLGISFEVKGPLVQRAGMQSVLGPTIQHESEDTNQVAKVTRCPIL